MDWLIVVGALSLGSVIGYLVRYFIRRFKNFTPSALTTVVTLIAGGAAVKFFSSEQQPWAVWLYPIGILMGLFYIRCSRSWRTNCVGQRKLATLYTRRLISKMKRAMCECN